MEEDSSQPFKRRSCPQATVRLATTQPQRLATSGFNSIVVCEEADEWAAGWGNEGGGMNPPSIRLFRTEKRGEERAHAYAVSLCEQSGLETYIVRQFTDEPYVFLVQTLDAYTGEIREAHLDDCR